MGARRRDRGSARIAAGIVALSVTRSAAADEAPAAAKKAEDYNLHFQETTVTEGHPSFRAAYSGASSLSPDAEVATSVTSTLFGGLRLWKGAEAYLDAELSGGSGLSAAGGVAGSANGETFRVGSATPVIYPARIYLRQTIDLGGCDEVVHGAPHQLGGVRSTRRLTFTAGKFGVADIFDNNRYTHDPRTQFLNWALMNSGAWDYPADTRGYTWGLTVEFTRDAWSLRGAVVMVPYEANGLQMDTHVDQANGLMLENEFRYTVQKKTGALRALVFLNNARMGSYADALTSPVLVPDVTASRQYGRTKFGFTLGLEQELTDSLGGFARLSWNDGRNETWAFTEIDRSVAFGMVQNGEPWGRRSDEVGTAIVVNGISSPHERYLAAGGRGFILGDGALDYDFEGIAEVYYRFALTREVAFSPDYEFVLHPGYNAARGPVHVFGVRAHIEF